MIRLHKDRRLFLQQIGQSPNTNLRYAECMSLKRVHEGLVGTIYVPACSHLLNSL